MNAQPDFQHSGAIITQRAVWDAPSCQPLLSLSPQTRLSNSRERPYGTAHKGGHPLPSLPEQKLPPGPPAPGRSQRGHFVSTGCFSPRSTRTYESFKLVSIQGRARRRAGPLLSPREGTERAPRPFRSGGARRGRSSVPRPP